MNADGCPKVEALCRRYLTALESGDLDALLQLFATNATANSPISGRQPAPEFYEHVLHITSGRTVALNDIFMTVHGAPKAAVHVTYTRTIDGHAPAVLDAVDIFELTPDLDHFTSVTIIYDTAPVRSDFDGPEANRS